MGSTVGGSKGKGRGWGSWKEKISLSSRQRPWAVASSCKQPPPLMPACPANVIIIWVPSPGKDGKAQAWGKDKQELLRWRRCGEASQGKGTADCVKAQCHDMVQLLWETFWRSRNEWGVWQGSCEINQERLAEARHRGVYGFVCKVRSGNSVLQGMGRKQKIFSSGMIRCGS